jgi:dinuclear metal center YbgI/SA1388 family protein
MKLNEFVRWLEARAPLALQESWDNCGLLVGDRDQEVTGVLCCLDADETVITEAVRRGCNVVLSHHPLVFKGLKRLTGSNAVERSVALAIKQGVALYAGHTNWDQIHGGVSFSLANRLGLREVQVLAPRNQSLLNFVVYVPESHASAVADAAFTAGAGRVGSYDECHFASDGLGSYRPLEGAKPFSGEVGRRSVAAEQRLEFVVPVTLRAAVHQAVCRAHPYEVVAHSWIALENSWPDAGYGAVGLLPSPIALSDFLEQCAKALGCEAIKYSTSDRSKLVRRVAVCGGSGADFVGAASAANADVYVTGDLKYHGFQDPPGGMTLVDVGHGESEWPFVHDWAEAIRSEFVTFAVLISESDNRPVRTYHHHG